MLVKPDLNIKFLNIDYKIPKSEDSCIKNIEEKIFVIFIGDTFVYKWTVMIEF